MDYFIGLECNGMKRLTGRDIKLGYVDSNTLPSYTALYEQLREYENLLEDKEMFFTKELPRKKEVIKFPLTWGDKGQKGYQMGWNACIDEILNGQ